MKQYIALIHKEAKSDYGISFPDFPGCITAASDLDEAKSEAKSALQFHIDGMIEDGETIPEPSSLEVVMSDDENREAVAFLVEVNVGKSQAKRINVTINEDLLRKIDQRASMLEKNRSLYISDLARLDLQQSQDQRPNA